MARRQKHSPKVDLFRDSMLKLGLPGLSSREEIYEDVRVINHLDDDDIELAVSHVACDWAPEINNIDGLIETIIDKMEIRGSYSSALTPTVLKNYLKAVYKAYAIFMAGFTSQNIKLLEDDQSRPVNSLLTKLGKISAYDNATFQTDKVVPVGAWGTENISNAVWAQNYLSYLPYFRMPSNVAQTAIYFFGGIFTQGKNYSTKLMRFWPKASTSANSKKLLVAIGDGENDSFEDIYADAVADVKVFYSSYNDLVTLLDHLGWTSDYIVNKDYRRDLTARSKLFKHDNSLELLLMNAQINMFYDLTVSDTRDENIIEFPNVSRDVTETSRDIKTTLGALEKATLIHNQLYYMHIAVLKHDGDVLNYHALPSGGINIDSWTAVSAQKQAVLENLTQAMMIFNRYGMFPLKDWVNIILTNDTDPGISITLTETTEPVLYTGIKIESRLTIRNEYMLRNIFGLDWRKNIQAVLSKIPNQPRNSE